MDILLQRIDEPNQSICREFIKDNYNIFNSAKGSEHNHQAYEGGYKVHISNCMVYAIELYYQYEFKFKLSSVLLVLFLHDIEKMWKYGMGVKFLSKKEKEEFRLAKIKEYGFVLTEEEHIALKYVEGEGDDYTNTRRVMNPLGAFCHCCDVISARIFYE